ncbi:Csu type fimbrial protein [Pontixanthobacter aquaemixtae]|uniref:Fimbrial major subunit CsuA/B family protein n=1 Tax=Pontixanthobacter aquaemixtae TaxID=1958940 RepID=A0A844ZS43_9SPHN|nr:spore coat U domain-containing protein [Pontixanthobacter aquaemixtae]MXO89816.1 fimbrial major subunit CsuA/B family protein [Pontixanthobacter aquaemixtae]
MLGFAAGALISSPALAQATDTTLPVSGEVVDRCNVTATPMHFLVANPGANTNVDSTATVQVQCTSVTLFFLVTMDNGENALGTQRRMVGAVSGDYLEYDIYKNAARTQRWGQGFFGGQVGFVLVAGSANFTAYGRIPTVSSFNAADSYSDTVVVTVQF